MKQSVIEACLRLLRYRLRCVSNAIEALEQLSRADAAEAQNRLTRTTGILAAMEEVQ